MHSMLTGRLNSIRTWSLLMKFFVVLLTLESSETCWDALKKAAPAASNWHRYGLSRGLQTTRRYSGRANKICTASAIWRRHVAANQKSYFTKTHIYSSDVATPWSIGIIHGGMWYGDRAMTCTSTRIEIEGWMIDRYVDRCLSSPDFWRMILCEWNVTFISLYF